MAQWMLPPEHLDPEEFGVVGQQVDIYHTGLLLLGLLLDDMPSFTVTEILEGRPRQIAEGLPPPYGWVIAKALRRHVSERTQSAIQFWRELRDASQSRTKMVSETVPGDWSHPQRESAGCAALQKVAFEAFSRDLPALLSEHSGKWVAYHGAERLGISDDDLALYELGRQRGLSPRSMLVIGIDPDADQIPVIYEYQFTSPEVPEDSELG
jgi:hypothetical protein